MIHTFSSRKVKGLSTTQGYDMHILGAQRMGINIISK